MENEPSLSQPARYNQNTSSSTHPSHQRGGYSRTGGDQQGQQRYNNYNSSNRRNGSSPSYSRGGMSGGYQRGGRGGGHSGRVLEDFDFESSNAKFDKEKMKGELNLPEEPKPAYDKTQSFFDNISNDVNERSERLSKKRNG